MRSPNRFTDPASGYYFDWTINHLTEDSFGKTRNFDHTAPTAHGSDPGIGLIRQQGSEGPMVIKLKGTILDPAQHVEFINWFGVCRRQSIYYRDFAGDQYEVIISVYSPTRERVGSNPRGGIVAPNHIWRYDMEMEVLRFISGPWEFSTP